MSNNVDRLSKYEKDALEQVRAHKAKQLSRVTRQLVPAKVREMAKRRADQVSARIHDSPGASKAVGAVGGAFTKAATGVLKAVSATAQTALPDGRVLNKFKAHDDSIAEVADIRKLDLSVIDKARPRKLDALYSLPAALEGAASGFVISGGEALAGLGSVAGVGVGGVPGFGVVAATMGGDAAFVLAASSRVVAHTALYYGYDPADIGEQMFMMSVISLGTSVKTSTKYLAYRELSQLAQMLARRATWKALNEKLLVKIAQKFATDMTVRLTQRKLGQAVPVAGILIGAGLNYLLIDQIADAANWAYRERFLTDKMGDTSGFWLPPQEPTVVDDADSDVADAEDEPDVSVLAMLHEADSEARPGEDDAGA